MSHASPIQFAPVAAKSPPPFAPAETGVDARFAALLAVQPHATSDPAVSSPDTVNDAAVLSQAAAAEPSGLTAVPAIPETIVRTSHASVIERPGHAASARKPVAARPAASPSAAAPGIMLTALAQAAQTLPTGSSAWAASARLSLRPLSVPSAGRTHAAWAETPSTGQGTGVEKAAVGQVAPEPAAPKGEAAPEATAPVARQPDVVPEAASRTVRGDDLPAVVAAAADPMAPAAPSQAAPAPAPSAQIAPAESPPVTQVSAAVAGVMTNSSPGTQSVTVHLKPEELGVVRIQVDQTTAGTAHVAIAAERPETLQLLRHDEPNLMRALDQAGVPTEGRTVSFQVEPAVASSRSGGTGTGPDTSERGQNDGSARRDDGSSSNPGQDQRQSRVRWLRAGLDITA